MRGAETIAERLKARGITRLFGVAGGASLDLIRACEQVGTVFTSTAEEASAAIAAGVFGQLAGVPGVCLAGLGPGAVNLAAGVAQAHWERRPLIAITERYTEADLAAMTMQKVDHGALFGTVARASATFSPGGPGSTLDWAFGQALGEPPGPVHLDLPYDLTGREVGQCGGRAAPPTRAELPQPDAVAAAAALLGRAQRPLLLLGSAARRAGGADEIRQLVERLGAPVLSTGQARGVLSEDHPLYAGVFTATGDAARWETRLIAQSDLVLAVGPDRDEWLQPWPYDVNVISLEPLPTRQPAFAQGRVVGDIEASLRGLLGAEPDRGSWPEGFLPAFWNQMRAALRQSPVGEIIHQARLAVPEDTILTSETGIYQQAAAYLWPVRSPDQYFGISGSRAVGHALPAAIGAKLARPDVPVVCMAGQRGLLARLGELATVARLQLPLVILAFNDGGLEGTTDMAAGVQPERPGFVKLAEGCGLRGIAVGGVDAFEPALRAALAANEATLIEIPAPPATLAPLAALIRG